MSLSPNSIPSDTRQFEPLVTIRQAATATGLKYWLVLRATNNGDIPTYQFGNQRRRVRISDIEAVIAQVSRRQVP